MAELTSSGLGGTEPLGIICTIHESQLSREKALNAYRNGIALPDVYIADRNNTDVPIVLGEDGQEMTFERRQELMRGKPTMCDSSGDLRKDLDFTGMFEEIETERLGASAERNRPEIRLVRPRELEIITEPLEEI